jgi:hypothetical protein
MADLPQNPIARLVLGFMNPDKEVFHSMLKEGVRETASVLLQNAAERLREPPKAKKENDDDH